MTTKYCLKSQCNPACSARVLTAVFFECYKYCENRDIKLSVAPA